MTHDGFYLTYVDDTIDEGKVGLLHGTLYIDAQRLSNSSCMNEMTLVAQDGTIDDCKVGSLHGTCACEVDDEVCL